MAGEHNYVGSPTSVRQAAYYPSMSVAPTAAAYGVGPAWIGGVQYWSDGAKFIRASQKLSLLSNSVYVLGDSFDERSKPSIASNNYNVPAYGIFSLTNMLLGNALYPVAVDGATGSGALVAGSSTNYGSGSSRLQAALNSGARYLMLRASVNDVSSASLYTAADLISAYKKIFQDANAAGMTVLCSTIAPSTAYNGTASKLKAALYFNAWLIQQASQLFDLIVLPVDQYIDPDSTSYAPLTSTGYATDGIHPDTKAAFLVAQSHAAILSKYVGNQYQWLATLASSGAAMSLNPLNAGTSGTAGSGVTGTIASNKVVRQSSGTPTACVCSKVSRTDNLPGYWQQVVFTPDTTNRLLECAQSGSAIAVNSDFAVGDIVSMICEYDVPSSNTGSDIRWPQVNMSFSGSTDTYNQATAFPVGGPANIGVSGWSGILATPPVAIPVGTTAISLNPRFYMSTVNPVTIKFGRMSVINYSLLSRIQSS